MWSSYTLCQYLMWHTSAGKLQTKTHASETVNKDLSEYNKGMNCIFTDVIKNQ